MNLNEVEAVRKWSNKEVERRSQGLKALTINIINFASAENGKILITEDLIRLAFKSKDAALRFLEMINERHPNSIPAYICGDSVKIDFANPEAIAS